MTTPQQPINQSTFRDEEYSATFKDLTVLLYARSAAAAKQVAIEHFRPKKKEIVLITVSKS